MDFSYLIHKISKPNLFSKIPNKKPLFIAKFLKSKPLVYLGFSKGVPILSFCTQTMQSSAVINMGYAVLSLEISLNEELLLVGGDSTKISAISTQSQTILFTLDIPSSPLQNLTVLPFQNKLFAVCNNSVQLWNLKTQKPIFLIKNFYTTEIRGFCMSQDANRIFGSRGLQTVGCLDLSKGKRFNVFLSLKQYARCHTLNKEESRLYTGTENCHLFCTDLRSHKRTFSEHLNFTSVTCIARRGQHIYLSTFQKFFFVIKDQAKFEVVFKWQDNTLLLHFALNERFLLTGGIRNFEVKLFNLKVLDTLILEYSRSRSWSKLSIA